MRAQACELIVRRRRSQLEECEAQLAHEAVKAYEMDAELQRHRQRPRALCPAMRGRLNARESAAPADATLRGHLALARSTHTPTRPHTCLSRAPCARAHTHRWVQQHDDL